MGVSFEIGKWFRGKVKKPFAGLEAGQTIYFSPHRWMKDHWIVFDGLNTVRAMHTTLMQERFESVRNEQGLLLEVDRQTAGEIQAGMKRMGFHGQTT
ncbi:MAG: hypothetical protein ACLQBD_11470 [Syntrophobacteraceae bacterium]